MIRTFLIATAAVALAASAVAAAPKAKPAPAAAQPVGPATADWRTPNPDDLLVIETNKGRVIVELAPDVAPAHVVRIRELARAHFYDGQTFFRVVDRFMDQTGDPTNTGTGGSDKPNLAAEFTFRRGAETPFVVAANQTVSEVGFVRSLPVTSQSSMLMPMTADGKVSAWALYCPGVAGMARDESPDGANSQFFLMRDGYPSLEKRYTAFGRVIAGQDVVRAIKVGEPVAPPQDRMEQVRLLSDLPEASRPKVRVIDPAGAWFKAEIERVRATKGADFSACDVQMPVEVK